MQHLQHLRANQKQGERTHKFVSRRLRGACSDQPNVIVLLSKTACAVYACGKPCRHRQRVRQIPKRATRKTGFSLASSPSSSSSLSPPIPCTAMLSSTVPCTAAQILSEAIISLKTTPIPELVSSHYPIYVKSRAWLQLRFCVQPEKKQTKRYQVWYRYVQENGANVSSRKNQKLRTSMKKRNPDILYTLIYTKIRREKTNTLW